jgi:ribonuclease HI
MELEIYTDCGGSVTDFGVGIHMIDHNENEKSYMLRTHIDDINKQYNINQPGSTSIGEIHAILTALSLVKNEEVKKIRVFTDNEHAFRILNKIPNVKKPQKKFLKTFQRIFDKFQTQFEIEVMWIKGHVGVYGNEIVDSLTQKAIKKSVKKNKIHNVEVPVSGEPIKYII